MRGLVTTQTERYNLLLARRLLLGRLMERLHGHIVVLVDFDRPIINLAHGLDLNVIAPRAIDALPGEVLVHSADAALNEVIEVFALRVDIVDASLAH